MKAEIYPIDDLPFGRLAIMPRPRAEDWLRGEVESWRQAGVSCVVSLLEPAEVAELGLQDEADVCRQLGLDFLAFPIPDRGVPQSDDELDALVRSLVSRLRGGNGVGIHCRIGVGRSSLVAACVLAALGQPVETAWLSIQRARGFSVPDTSEQRAWVATFIEQANLRQKKAREESTSSGLGVSETSRTFRWAAFQDRVRLHCGSRYTPVYHHISRGWQYIPVHPFADEPDDLARLNLQPEDCRSVDAWWGIDGDATLLESGVIGWFNGPARLFAKPTQKDQQWVYLVAVLDAPFVTRVAFEAAMVRFADAGFPNDPRFRLQWGDPPMEI